MQKIQSTLSSKYQTVIPAQVRKALNLKAGSKIIWQVINLANKKRVLAEPKPSSWHQYTRGLGKHVWENIDVEEYIKNLRAEWKDQS